MATESTASTAQTAPEAPAKRGRRQEKVGLVTSAKMSKTIVVKVERRFTHPLLKKTVRRSKKYHAHDETNAHKAGDAVSIEETKPISKLKRWTVVKVTGK